MLQASTLPVAFVAYFTSLSTGNPVIKLLILKGYPAIDSAGQRICRVNRLAARAVTLESG